MPLIILETSYIYQERPPMMKSLNDLKSSHTALHKNINLIFDYKHFKTDSAIFLHFFFCLWSFYERARVHARTLSHSLSPPLFLSSIECIRTGNTVYAWYLEIVTFSLKTFFITWLLRTEIYSNCSYWKGNTSVVTLHIDLSSEQQFFALGL